MDQHGTTVISGDSALLTSTLRKAFNSVSLSKDERLLNSSLGTISAFAVKLQLGANIVSRSEDLLRAALKGGLALCRSTDVVIAATLYTACRIEGFPRVLQEVASALGLEKTDLAKMSRSLAAALGPEVQGQLGQVLPEQLVERMVSQLRLSFRLADCSRDCCRRVAELGLLGGVHPNIAAAAVILFVHGLALAPLRVSRDFLASLAQVSLASSVDPVLKAHIRLVPARAEISPTRLPGLTAACKQTATASANSSCSTTGSTSVGEILSSPKAKAVLFSRRTPTAIGGVKDETVGTKRLRVRGGLGLGCRAGASVSCGGISDEDSECVSAAVSQCSSAETDTVVVGFNPTDSPVDVVSVETPMHGDGGGASPAIPSLFGARGEDSNFKAKVKAAFAEHCCSDKRPRIG